MESRLGTLLLRLSETKAIELRPFFAINFQIVELGMPPGTLRPHHAEEIAELMWEVALREKLYFDGVIGLTPTDERIARFFIDAGREGRLERKIPLLRFGFRGGGISLLVDTGGLRRGTILMVNSSIAFGERATLATREIRSHGFMVRNLLSFIDGEEGAREGLANLGVALHSVTTKSEVIKYFKASGFIHS